MPTVRNPHRREVRYARQASADACAFCRLLAIRPEAQYETEATALFAGHEMGKLYHDECHCTAVPIDPGETYIMPGYTEQWEADYADARDDSDVESFEDYLNFMRRAQYARDNPKDEPTSEATSSPTRRAAAIMRDNVITKSVEATLQPVDIDENSNGEFHAILSTEDLDRDAEELDADDWLLPLPNRIHIDTDHSMSVERTAGSAVPTLEGRQLHVRGMFASVPHAQLARTLVREGHVDKMSVTYRVVKDANGNKKRELLSGAFVAVPANPNAVVLSAKSARTDDDAKTPYGPKSEVTYADPGYQDDGKARYPVDTADHCRSAWSYINQPANAAKYSPAELSKIKGRIRSAAAKFDITIADDKKALALDVLSKQLDAGDDNPKPKHDDMIQAIHDAAVQLGGQCTNRTQADTGEDEGANKDFRIVFNDEARTAHIETKASSLTAGSLQESAEESTAATTTDAKSAVVAAADESADEATQQAFLAARGRSLAFLMNKNLERD